MENLTRRIIWFLFFLLGWIVLIVNGTRSKKIHLNFIQELKELCKKHSKYIEDSDYRLIYKKRL